MEMKKLLDQILEAGQEMATRGRNLAEQKLGVPATGDLRDANLSGLKKGAAVGGLLALLLGTRAGRRIAGPAVKLGSLAALSTLAYKAYTKWQASKGPSGASGKPLTELSEDAAHGRSHILFRAMIAAANADGHIDASERTRLEQELEKMGLDDATHSAITHELTHPASAEELAAAVDSPSAAAEIYMASLLVIDVDHPQERLYLDTLADRLGLSRDLVDELHQAAMAHA